MSRTLLHLGERFTMPIEAVTQTFGLLAVRGAGKSNAAVVMAEEFYACGVPWVAVDPKGDWWGMRSASDGKGPGLPLPVLGGLHGDVPLVADSGILVADLIVDENLTAVLDVSEFSKNERARFLVDFFDRLYRRHKSARGTKTETPRHVFLEEAHEYIPQQVGREEGRLKEAAARIVLAGRTFGLGATVASQRSARLHKDVLTQVETLIPMRTTSPQDRKAILDWVAEHQAGRELVDALPELEDGEAFIWSPHFLGRMERVRFRLRKTFDSGATPKMGRVVASPTVAEIDLPALRARMEAVVERTKADDPAELRKKVAALERELRNAPKALAEPIVERIEVAVITEGQLDQLRRTTAALRGSTEDIDAWTHHVVDAIQKAIEAPKILADGLRQQVDRLEQLIGVGKGQPVQEARRREPATPPPRTGRALSPASPDPQRERPEIRAGARRILETLARHHPMQVTRAQLGVLAKFKITGGTFTTYFGLLRREGLIAETDGLIRITEDGMAYIGHVERVPMTPDELLEVWRGSLRAGARRMLDTLVEVYPRWLERDELATALDMAVTGGTFTTYLGTLRRNNLIESDGGRVRASADLFIGASA